MALDVYVGSLRRFYSGDWQSAADKAAPSGAARREADRPTADRPADVERIRASVLSWRRNLAASLVSTTTVPIDWNESPEAPYFTGQVGWDGFGSLVLWAAYAESPALRRPATLAEEWDDDPALIRCNAEGFRSRYSNLVRNVELWLPVPLPFTFEGEDIDARRIVMGSTEMLSRQLADLNNATWKAKPEEIAGWARRQLSQEGSLELQARYAFGVMSDLVHKAVEYRLPMKLDL